MERIKILGVDEEYFHEQLSNGLNVYMLVNNRVNNFYITFSTKYGSVDTEFKLDGDEKYNKVHNGVAHFLEHVNFNEDINTTAEDYFSKIGSEINAYTSFDVTVYEVTSSTLFKENLEHLLDYVQKPYFTKKLIEKEKGIICEEIKMTKNNPGSKLYYGSNKALYKKDKRRNLITGEIKDVKEITVEELQMVYDNFYNPHNMNLVITGNFDPEEAIKIIRNNQNNKTFPSYKNPIRKKIVEPMEVNDVYKEIEANVEIPKGIISYKMNKDIFNKYDDRTLGIYLNIILRNNLGVTSLFKEELLEKGLVTFLGYSSEIFQDIVTITIDFESRVPDKVIPIIKEKMNKLEVSSADLERRIKCNIASLINNFDYIEYVNNDFIESLINYGNYENNMFGLYKSLNIEDLNDIINRLDLDNSSVALLVPYK